MNEATWEIFDGLFKTLQRQSRRMEDLETRITELERRLRERDPEAATFAERPVLKVAEPEPVECGRCSRYHSPELPCVTPADEVWAKYSEDVKGVPV